MEQMKSSEKQKIQTLLNEVYTEYKYVFRKYKKHSSHFSRNGLYKQWIKRGSYRYEAKY